MDQFDVPLDADGKIVDFLEERSLEPTPEEFVRQRYLRVLHYEYAYSKKVMRREVSVQYGSKELVDSTGRPVRADIVIYKNAKACRDKDQGGIVLVVECKAPNESTGYNQLVSYIFNTSANGGVWHNGGETLYFRRITAPNNDLIPWTGIPRVSEAWDALGRRKKEDLRRPKDIKGLLRLCHNKLHGRGVDGDEEDLTMDMVRIILAKAMDEERPGDLPDFYCTPEEYSNPSKRGEVTSRVNTLFSEVVSHNPDVFAAHERISVGERALCDVVVELQAYRLLSDLSASDDWDLMGAAYEQYTATYLKRQRGQFFTNRLVVDVMAQIVDPSYDDIILDPAGGSGGFLTGAMRHVRKKILSSNDSTISKQRQLDKHRTRLFMIEISKRLVKIAKTAMILNGDGHTGMTQGDSLGSFQSLDTTIRSTAGKEKPTVILTNPPFAGVGEGRITDSAVLDNFQTGMKWSRKNGELIKLSGTASGGVPPEMLFFERCLQWIAPGGTIGIVMPKSFLDTQTYAPARKLLFTDFKLLAVINCHKDTFQPHTGVRTCLVFVQRPVEAMEDYAIFLAISKKIGQDSEGIPIFSRDKEGNLTDQLDHDLEKILTDYQDFKAGKLISSEYRFQISKSDIDENLCINPQFYLPHLNESIRQVEAIDGKQGWMVSTLGQVCPSVKVFKGPRLKSENLIVEQLGPFVEPYYTPSAVLQEKGDSAKLLDVSLASGKQVKAINAVRIKRGDIVVTRSGTVGRVTMITKRLHDAIVSDDLIRVRIPDENVRFYVFAFLQTEVAQNQLLKNEYGAVQQHLEPNHVSDVLIPLPEEISGVSDVIERAKTAFESKEALEVANAAMEASTKGMWDSLQCGGIQQIITADI